MDEAYDLLTRAFDLTEDEAERRRILLRRGDMLAKVGEYARADKELTALLPDLDGREEVEGRSRSGSPCIGRSRPNGRSRRRNAR